MRKNLGVWIDHEKAYLVTLDEEDTPSVACIESGVDPRTKPRGGPRGVGGVPQGKIDRARHEQLRRFYEQVAGSLGDAEQIWRLRPAHRAAPGLHALQ